METESGPAVFPIARGSSSTFWFTAAVVGITVIVPTTEGYTLLASPEDPEGFLAALTSFKSSGGSGEKLSPRRFPLAPAVASNASLLGYLAIAGLVPVLLAGLLGGLTWVSRRV